MPDDDDDDDGGVPPTRCRSVPKSGNRCSVSPLVCCMCEPNTCARCQTHCHQSDTITLVKPGGEDKLHISAATKSSLNVAPAVTY